MAGDRRGMQWVTRDYVYLDRVASPWLIKRFVDPAAEFAFVGWGSDVALPSGAIPFALPGYELGEHDEEGTTFQKILDKYQLRDAALQRLARMVARGVHFRLRREWPQRADPDEQIGVALMRISEGMMLVYHDDATILERSFVVYDALYAHLRAQEMIAARGLELPPSEGRGPTNRTKFLRALLDAERR